MVNAQLTRWFVSFAEFSCSEGHPGLVRFMPMTRSCNIRHHRSDADVAHLTKCADAVARWHLENGLLLNVSKTEALITGSQE